MKMNKCEKNYKKNKVRAHAIINNQLYDINF